MKQRILVLGAGGFIGRHVTEALAGSDWAAPVAAGRRPVAAGQTDRVQVDAMDKIQLQRAMADVAGVVNCVAGDGATIVGSARALFDVAAGLPQKPRIVHLSSMAVYGDAAGEVDETTAVGAGLSPYGAAKLEAERLAGADPAVVSLRLGIVYGPHSAQWTGRIAQLLHARRLGDLGVGGDGYCNLTYVGDAVAAIICGLRLADADGGIFNVAMPDPPTWNEYFTRFAQALGAVPLARISRRRLRIESTLWAPPLKIAEILTGKVAPRLQRSLPQAIPPSLVQLFRQEIRMRVGKVEERFALPWTSLEKGLERSAQWYRAA